MQIVPFDETKSKNGNSFAKCCGAMYQPLEKTTMVTSNANEGDTCFLNWETRRL